VDLGGIGKGLALRWAAAALDRWLATAPGPTLGYLVDAGGDIVASGTPDGTAPWLVAIEDPAGGTGPVAVVAIGERGGIATSSIRRLRWEHEGRAVHHLIDPRTGEPGGDGLAAVTVAGPDPAWAEVWSKALFLEGPAGIAATARARGLAAWWVTSDGLLEMTPAARVRTAWIAAEA
jgi:thiamine biosynthesis lipoprotein